MDKVTQQRAAALRIPEDLFIVGLPFTRNELGALQSRGFLRETLPGYFLDVRYPYDSQARAMIAAYVAGKRLRPADVLCRLTAAWVHGLVPATTLMCISTATYRRPQPTELGLAYEYVQLDIADDELMQRKQVLLSEPLRTVCDMACHDPLPLVVPALQRVQRMGDRYLNLESITARLKQYKPSSPVQRALRLVNSLDEVAA